MDTGKPFIIRNLDAGYANTPDENVLYKTLTAIYALDNDKLTTVYWGFLQTTNFTKLHQFGTSLPVFDNHIFLSWQYSSNHIFLIC